MINLIFPLPPLIVKCTTSTVNLRMLVSAIEAVLRKSIRLTNLIHLEMKRRLPSGKPTTKRKKNNIINKGGESFVFELRLREVPLSQRTPSHHPKETDRLRVSRN